jgi:DNA-binding LytR/AlgR family response regulator
MVVLGTRRAKPRRLPPIAHFVLKKGSQSVTVPVDNIDLIHGGGGRLRIVQGATIYLAHGRLSDVERGLDQRFIRTSRSTVINVASVCRCAADEGDEIALYLRGNRRVLVTRRYAKAVRRALNDMLPAASSAASG